MIYTILVAGVLNFFLGLLAFQYGKKNKSLLAFSFFCILTSIWVLLNFFVYFYSIIPLVRYTYALGPLVMSALLAWSYFYDSKKEYFWLPFTFYFVGLIITFISAFHSIVIGNVYSISISGIIAEEGRFFMQWGFYVMGAYILSLINVLRVYRRSRQDERSQAKQVLIGLLGFGGVSMLVSVVLPSFGIMEFTNLDSPSSLIFAVLAFVAIIKYKLFGTKVLIAQVLVFFLISIAAVDIFYARTPMEMLFRFIFFIVMLAIGIFLIKSVFNEVERKEELEAANAQLRKLDEAKTEFISIASHQLRTPLTTSRGFLSLMHEGNYGKIPKKLMHPVERISNANERLLHLVEDLLNITRIESGRMVFEFQKEKVEKLLKEAVESFDLIAKEREIHLSLVLPKRPLPSVFIDKSKVMEAVSNLVDNSIKYTKEGSVTVSAEQNDKVVRIIVSDTGIGIAKEDLESIFGKFSRGSNQKRLTSTGTGLGLYFGKKVVEANHGKMRVESDGIGKGSRFIIEIPAIEKVESDKSNVGELIESL